LDKETLLAFVDEIGDRGYSRKSSEYFAMSAVLFPVSVQLVAGRLGIKKPRCASYKLTL